MIKLDILIFVTIMTSFFLAILGGRMAELNQAPLMRVIIAVILMITAIVLSLPKND